MNRLIQMDHPRMGTAMVAPYHKSSQKSAQSAPKPAGKSSLSAEQKDRLAKWKKEYQKDQHEASLAAQSGTKVAGKKNNVP